MPPKLELKNQKFGRLTVLEELPERNPGGKVRWSCLCDCGKTTVTTGKELKGGHTKSCGCYARDVSREVNTHHGHGVKGKETSEYVAWLGLKARCNSLSCPEFHRYGGRGITYDPSWSDFRNFIADMGLKPFKDAQIDRIDNDGNYNKANCRWTTRQENQRNRSTNRIMTLNGISATLVEWSEKMGIKRSTLARRVNSLRWDDYAALTTPIYGKRSQQCQI